MAMMLPTIGRDTSPFDAWVIPAINNAKIELLCCPTNAHHISAAISDGRISRGEIPCSFIGALQRNPTPDKSRNLRIRRATGEDWR
jgi:hypothetical protein